MNVLTESNLPYTLIKRGKVRDIYEIEDALLIVSTDRLSAFDCVLPNGIPDKGKVLNLLSLFWFNMTKDIIPNHVLTKEIELPEEIRDQCMLVQRANPIEFEFIVRGYIAGSGWKDYRETGKISGIHLPEGLIESQRLSKPILTPTTKAKLGHDQPVTITEVADKIGKNISHRIVDASIKIYERARDFAEKRNLIIADTKLEFGINKDGNLLLIDELLTPDSSRFWDLKNYSPGNAQESFDKQFVRDYLEYVGWDKTPPAPPLPEDVIKKTRDKYLKALKLLTSPNES